MIITEYRWVCDFCGVHSPAMPKDEKPQGWLELELPIVVAVRNGARVNHFCCERHLAFWQREER